MSALYLPVLPTGITDAVESLRDPCLLKRVGGPPSLISDFGGAGEAADVAPACWTTLVVNFQRLLHVGSYNALSLSEDH